MPKKSIAALFGLMTVLALPACDTNNDDDATPTPTVTVTATATATPSGRAAATDKVHLVCPDPVGEVDALTDGEDEWGSAYVVDSDVVLEPVAFANIEGTASDGSKFSDPDETKPGATKDGSIKCSFTMSVKDEETDVDIKGDVWVLVKNGRNNNRGD